MQRAHAVICAAALTLTRERGCAAMAADDVAAFAGVSRRIVFNHFASRASLLVIDLEPPAPTVIEAFVSSSGNLPEDPSALLASGTGSVGSERSWLLSFPEIMWNNPEMECAVHGRPCITVQSLAEIAGHHLGTESDDLRIRAVVALTMAVQRSPLDLWYGRSHPQEERREVVTPPENPEVPEVSKRRSQVPLVDAVRAMVEAISEAVSPPRLSCS